MKKFLAILIVLTLCLSQLQVCAGGVPSTQKVAKQIISNIKTSKKVNLKNKHISLKFVKAVTLEGISVIQLKHVPTNKILTFYYWDSSYSQYKTHIFKYYPYDDRLTVTSKYNIIIFDDWDT